MKRLCRRSSSSCKNKARPKNALHFLPACPVVADSRHPMRLQMPPNHRLKLTGSKIAAPHKGCTGFRRIRSVALAMALNYEYLVYKLRGNQ